MSPRKTASGAPDFSRIASDVSLGKDVKIHGFWLAFPQHTLYLVVETDDIVHLQRFLQPGAGVTVAEITPVSDAPVPLAG